MADKGNWSVCAQRPTQVIYINLGPTQGPLVVERVHNNGPCAVTIGGGAAFLDPGTDCDVSGARIEIALAGPPRCGGRRGEERCDEASGTYDLVCCQPPPQVGTPAAAPPGQPGNGGAGNGEGN